MLGVLRDGEFNEPYPFMNENGFCCLSLARFYHVRLQRQ
jgi:hypothetical protein